MYGSQGTQSSQTRCEANVPVHCECNDAQPSITRTFALCGSPLPHALSGLSLGVMIRLNCSSMSIVAPSRPPSPAQMALRST